MLFIGDSITDCGRRVEHAPLGDGYVHLFSELATARLPERRVRYVNMGIGGNTVSTSWSGGRPTCWTSGQTGCP